jgi:4-diphosphocytidyl-2-C-methyl-D-erythritol kinase
VNLFLRIVRRREDGYHDLASLFHVRRRPPRLG